jgi:hypothetical protein
MPIVLGVPHIANDVRYLVLPLPRKQVVLSLFACAVLVGLKATSLVTGDSLVRPEMAIIAAWLLGMLAVGGMHQRGAWLLAGTVGLAIVALPVQFAIVAAFLHNLVAIVAWLVVKRPARRDALAVLAAIAGALGVLAVAGPTVAAWTGGTTSPWLGVDEAALVMFGGVPLATARALMIGFAFLQAVHYAIWLDWIPRGARRRPGRPWLAVAAGTLVVIAAALVDAAWARTTYLALATFHIYLELVVLGARLARRAGGARSAL